MDAIYQTKLYKLILSYSMHTIKYCRYNTFVKVLAFTVDEYNGLNTKYCIYVKLSFNEINKTIFTEYIISEYASEEEASIIDKFEINRYARPALPPKWTTYRDSDSFDIYIFYYSGLEKQYVRRRVEIRRYKNILRLIPEEPKYEWITKEIIDLFINNKEYNILT